MVKDEAILKKIAQQPRREATLKQVIRDFGLHGAARHQLKSRLLEMVAQRKLVAGVDGRYSIPQEKKAHNRDTESTEKHSDNKPGKNQVAGRLSMHRDGFGFVIPEDEAIRGRIEGDIYIGGYAIGSA